MPQPCSTVRINGPALRELRTERGLTVRQVAAKIGRHPQSIRKLETGDKKVASEVFARQIAIALGPSVAVADFAIADGEHGTSDEAEADEVAA